MLFAAKELEKMHGGIIVVKDNTVLAQIKLEIGGVMTNRKYSDVESNLKITDKGLFDVVNFKFIDIFE